MRERRKAIWRKYMSERDREEECERKKQERWRRGKEAK